MNKYEILLNEAISSNISVDENFPFMGELSGLYVDGNIALSNKLETSAEKVCILAEEMGHHYTSVGNIINPSYLQNKKQEHQARLWGYKKLIELSAIVNAFFAGCENWYDTAEFLGVTEEYLHECIDCYRAKYGVYTTVDNYTIFFIPTLRITENPK